VRVSLAMNEAIDEQTPRSRRKILLVGGLALAGVYVAGAVVRVPWVQDDLTTRVQRDLAAKGYVVTADFSGQDGTLRCATPLSDPAAALSLAKGVWGVHAITLDASCGVANGDGSGATSTTIAAPSTTAPATTVAPTTTAAPTTTEAVTTTTAAPAPVVSAVLANGVLTLTGKVASEAQHQALLARAGTVVAAANVVDQITVDPAVAFDDATATNLGNLLAAMPPNLVSGEAGWNGTSLYASGVYADDVARASFQSAATQVGISADLQPRPAATADQAAALEAELNALVAAEPILFDKGKSTISATSQSTVQKVAGIAKRYAGVKIDVQGHTDSEGDAGRNRTLSEQRAAAVRDALVALGVPAADLTSTGFGEDGLILGADGKEDPAKSRRVVFGVSLQ